jgi:hypothetical protein
MQDSKTKEIQIRNKKIKKIKDFKERRIHSKYAILKVPGNTIYYRHFQRT